MAEKKTQEMDKEQAERIERRWEKFQEMMGYTDEELALYRSRPDNVRAMEKAPKFRDYNIVAEVIEAHNCWAGHKVGDKFVFTSNGVLITDQCPERMCCFAISTFEIHVHAIIERITEEGWELALWNDTYHCPGIGIRKGGVGEIIMRLYAQRLEK